MTHESHDPIISKFSRYIETPHPVYVLQVGKYLRLLQTNRWLNCVNYRNNHNVPGTLATLSLRPATHYQVDLTTGTPDQVYLIVCVLNCSSGTYQVDLTDRPLQPYMSGPPDSVCVHQVSGIYLIKWPDSEWLA
jgi:hypothetical protein